MCVCVRACVGGCVCTIINVPSCVVEECLVGVMTIYDLAQLIGAFSLVFYALFVRSQYLRIEEVYHS